MKQAGLINNYISSVSKFKVVIRQETDPKNNKYNIRQNMAVCTLYGVAHGKSFLTHFHFGAASQKCLI